MKHAVLALCLALIGLSGVNLLWPSHTYAYTPDSYCMYHVLGSLFGDFGGNGYNWNSQRTTWLGWVNKDPAVAQRFRSCAQLMASKPGMYGLVASPAPSVVTTAEGADLYNFHFTFDFPFDALAAPVASGSYYQKRAFLMSIVEGEGSSGANARGKLLDENHCLDGGTKCADGYAQHVVAAKKVAEALYLSTYYTQRNCTLLTMEYCTPLSEAELTTYPALELHVADSDLAINKVAAWPFASYVRAPGGQYSPDTTPPTVNLTAPQNGVTLSGLTNLTTRVTDTYHMGVKRVDFLMDGVLIGSDTTAPYTYALDTTTKANGSHSLKARVFDYNDAASSSVAQSVTILNP